METCRTRMRFTPMRIVSGMRSPIRVAFVFNAQDHQILHGLPIACELSRIRPDFAVTVFARDEAQLAYCRRLADHYPRHRLGFAKLRSPWLPAAVRRRIGAMKVAILWASRQLFESFDALVVPERTTLLLKKFGVRRPLYIHTAHGGGGADRPDDPRLGQFDLLLLPNVRRLTDVMAAGNTQCAAVYGYPKLDLVHRMSAAPPKLFANDHPTVLYNPHHRAGTTSWTELGWALLDHFARQRDYNLIFAPHVRLFDPPERHRQMFRRYDALEHIRVDLGSSASVDMTYTLAADVYLGDISSQVLEFLVKPRPCIFLNPRRLPWRDDPDFVNWQLGRVVVDVDGMAEALASRAEWQPDYEPLQCAAFEAAFPTLGEPAPILGARLIAAFLTEGRLPVEAEHLYAA